MAAHCQRTSSMSSACLPQTQAATPTSDVVCRSVNTNESVVLTLAETTKADFLTAEADFKNQLLSVLGSGLSILIPRRKEFTVRISSVNRMSATLLTAAPNLRPIQVTQETVVFGLLNITIAVVNTTLDPPQLVPQATVLQLLRAEHWRTGALPGPCTAPMSSLVQLLSSCAQTASRRKTWPATAVRRASRTTSPPPTKAAFRRTLTSFTALWSAARCVT